MELISNLHLILKTSELGYYFKLEFYDEIQYSIIEFNFTKKNWDKEFNISFIDSDIQEIKKTVTNSKFINRLYYNNKYSIIKNFNNNDYKYNLKLLIYLTSNGWLRSREKELTVIFNMLNRKKKINNLFKANE